MLPSALPTGKVTVLRGRAGFEVAIEGKDGKLVAAKLLSRLGRPCVVRYGDKTLCPVRKLMPAWQAKRVEEFPPSQGGQGPPGRSRHGWEFPKRFARGALV